jgi:hypothetical protein
MTVAYNKSFVTATIASGGTTSEAIPLLDVAMAGFITPAALTGTAFTFTVCNTADGTFVALYDSEGNPVSVTVTTSRAYGLTGSEADALAPWPFAKIVSGSAEGGERSIVVCLK